jgi:PAS domain-containing protein
LFQTALDGTIAAANPALARIAGYGSVEEFLRDVEVFYQDLGPRREPIRAVAERGGVRTAGASAPGRA